MKRIIIFLLAIALFALTACEEKTPDNVLSQEKMEEVIYELMRIDGACEQKYIMRGDTLKYSLYNSLFEKEGITLEEFDTSLVWYANHIDKFETITDNVKTRLKKERDEYSE